jgi:hypothetical protein
VGKFILQKGAFIKKPITTSKTWNNGGQFHDRYSRHFQIFTESGQAILLDEDSAQLLHDIEFTSPSAPDDLCSGRSNNGWKF